MTVRRLVGTFIFAAICGCGAFLSLNEDDPPIPPTPNPTPVADAGNDAADADADPDATVPDDTPPENGNCLTDKDFRHRCDGTKFTCCAGFYCQNGAKRCAPCSPIGGPCDKGQCCVTGTTCVVDTCK